MSLKPGVKLDGIAAQTVVGMQEVREVYRSRGVPFTITSVNDSTHMAGSKHYEGLAFDVRSAEKYGLPGSLDDKLLVEIKAALNEEWDVVLEGDTGSPNRHIHVEWDPK